MWQLEYNITYQVISKKDENMEEIKMEEKISFQELFELFQVLKKRLKVIIILAFITTIISIIFTHFFIAPTYQASTQLVVSRSDGDNAVTNAEISGNIQLINTFNEILVSPTILTQVIEELNLNDESITSLSRMMEARNASNSLVITLSVRNENPELAYNIANKTAEIFERDLPDIFNFDNVSILAPALIPRNPVSPRITINAGIGFLVGIMSGIFIVFLLEFLDKTIKTEHEIERLVNLPVLGVIPGMKPEDFKIKRTMSDLA